MSCTNRFYKFTHFSGFHSNDADFFPPTGCLFENGLCESFEVCINGELLKDYILHFHCLK